MAHRDYQHSRPLDVQLGHEYVVQDVPSCQRTSTSVTLPMDNNIICGTPQEPHTESSGQYSVPVIQMDNKDSQQDSQSHTQHVCDATYPAILVTLACCSAGK